MANTRSIVENKFSLSPTAAAPAARPARAENLAGPEGTCPIRFLNQKVCDAICSIKSDRIEGPALEAKKSYDPIHAVSR